MNLHFNYLLEGLVLGFIAGALPGPVMMFIFSQVFKNGFWSGVKVQLGATILDIVRIFLILILFASLPRNDLLIGLIAFLGSIFLGYMAYSNFVFKSELNDKVELIKDPWIQGILGGLLNPYPYVFWLTVGGSTFLLARETGTVLSPVVFVAAFLIAILAVSVVISFLADKAKDFMSSKYYLYFVRLLGLALLYFAIVYLVDSIKYFF
ncbi:MAG: LysE family transporter [Candidatus Doudnabacteria bacterium]